MEIVIEYVLLDNFLIDSLLLYLMSLTLKLPINRLGLVTASCFGAGFAVVSPLIPVSGVWAIIIKLLVAVVISYMVNFTHKKLLLKSSVFVGYTFMFGGGLIAIFNFLGVTVYDGLNVAYISSLPLVTIIVSIIVFAIIVARLIRSLFKAHRLTECSCDIAIKVNDKVASLRGFVDTGNTLKNSQGKSIIIINEDTLSFWFTPYERMQIMLGKPIGLKNCEKVSVSSLGGKYYIPVFDCLVEVSGTSKTAALGVAPSKIKCGDCLAIVGKEIIEV